MPDANGRFRGITVPRLPWLDALAGNVTGLAETQADLTRMVTDWAGTGKTFDSLRADIAADIKEMTDAPDDENEVAP